MGTKSVKAYLQYVINLEVEVDLDDPHFSNKDDETDWVYGVVDTLARLHLAKNLVPHHTDLANLVAVEGEPTFSDIDIDLEDGEVTDIQWTPEDDQYGGSDGLKGVNA